MRLCYDNWCLHTSKKVSLHPYHILFHNVDALHKMNNITVKFVRGPREAVTLSLLTYLQPIPWELVSMVKVTVGFSNFPGNERSKAKTIYLSQFRKLFVCICLKVANALVYAVIPKLLHLVLIGPLRLVL